MQPSIKSGEVECVYLHRYEGEARDPEILQLLSGLGDLLANFPGMGKKYGRWRAHNEARVAANLEPEEVPEELYDYDLLARLKDRAYEQIYEDKSGEHGTVAVTLEESVSMDMFLRMHAGNSTELIPAAPFLLSVCKVFETETNLADIEQ